jgi:hypothetical protein
VAVAAPDAGAAEPDEMSGLSPLKKVHPAQPKPPKAAGCHYDETYAGAARQTMAQLQRGASRVKRDELEDLGDELHDAFRQKDCKAVEAVLKKMRAVAAAK